MDIGDSARSQSAPAAKDLDPDAIPPGSPDSSHSGSKSGSSLSNLSEARNVAPDLSPPDSPTGSTAKLVLPSEFLDRMDLLSGSDTKDISGSVPLAPRPGSGGPRPGSGMLPESRPLSGVSGTGRPGSERHRVLPPIGQTAQDLPDY